jgi:hypothetical protein
MNRNVLIVTALVMVLAACKPQPGEPPMVGAAVDAVACAVG